MSAPRQPTLADVASFANLELAYRRARRGKRVRAEVARFELRLEEELVALAEALREGRYQPGAYRTFWVSRPVRRFISAAPFRDRVVQHALCAWIEPIFETEFLPCSFACRRGMGTHRALRAARRFAREYSHVLHADVRKFFPSIDHETLMELLGARLDDPGVRALCATIIAASNPQEEVIEYFPGDDLWTPLSRRRGLPIGNLTSQLFGNLMLHGVDAYVTNAMGERAYLRYADDMLLFGHDPALLWARAREIGAVLARARLRLHPRKTVVTRVDAGFSFLGFRLDGEHVRLQGRRWIAARRRLRRLPDLVARGVVDQSQAAASIRGWQAHAAHADAWPLRTRISRELVFVARCGTGRHERVLRGGSWNNDATNLRSANRNNNDPTNRNDNNGFRCLRDTRSNLMPVRARAARGHGRGGSASPCPAPRTRGFPDPKRRPGRAPQLRRAAPSRRSARAMAIRSGFRERSGSGGVR